MHGTTNNYYYLFNVYLYVIPCDFVVVKCSSIYILTEVSTQKVGHAINIDICHPRQAKTLYDDKEVKCVIYFNHIYDCDKKYFYHIPIFIFMK